MFVSFCVGQIIHVFARVDLTWHASANHSLCEPRRLGLCGVADGRAAPQTTRHRRGVGAETHLVLI